MICLSTCLSFCLTCPDIHSAARSPLPVKLRLSFIHLSIHLHLSTHLCLLSLPQVKLLVEEGKADTTVRDRWGQTPLDEAIRVRAAAIAEFLRTKMAERGAAEATSTSADAR
jgi:hypothetical protein